MRPMMRLVLGLAALGRDFGGRRRRPPGTCDRGAIGGDQRAESAVFPVSRQSASLRRLVTVGHPRSAIAAHLFRARIGQGARIDWVSQARSIGAGSMEITNADPNKALELAVNFNGLEGTSAFDVSPSGSGSKVTWSFGYEIPDRARSSAGRLSRSMVSSAPSIARASTS